MAKQWFYQDEFGDEVGPIDAGRVAKLVSNETIQRHTLIWREGMPEWVEAQRIAKLWKHAPTRTKANARDSQQPQPRRSPPRRRSTQDDEFAAIANDDTFDSLPPLNAAPVNARTSTFRSQEKKRRSSERIAASAVGKPSSVGLRILACVGDCFVVSFLNALWVAAVGEILRQILGTETLVRFLLQFPSWIRSGFLPAAFVIVVAIYESSPRQATLLKSHFGMVVVDMLGRPITFFRSLARQVVCFAVLFLPLYVANVVMDLKLRGVLGLCVGFSPFLGSLTLAAFTSKKQYLHDLVVGTMVVDRS